MADQDIELDDDSMFENLYDDPEPEPSKNESTKPEVDDPTPAAEPEPTENFKAEDTDFNINTELDQDRGAGHATHNGGGDYEKPIGMKDDGKMFIGGLNWETTDQSLKDYFSRFGEVIDCQVMRDGATGRSRGFGFLTFKEPKTVNSVMTKEHSLDGKLIDPKRAIPRDEQERTAKIFVGGVSQECTDSEFREFFEQFGRVLDATLMMDKETGRPRGFGFVTFDSDAAVDRTLAQDLEIKGKWMEVKRAEPRGNLRDGDGGGGHSKFGRQNRGHNFNNENQQNQNGQNQQGNTMSMSQAATYWQMMQTMFKQSQMMANANGGGMNPMAAMQMQQMMAARGMNPAMMQQQMGNMQGNMGNMQAGNMQGGGGYPGMQSPGSGSPMNGAAAPRPAFNAQDQLMFEQQKYERQQNVRMQSGSFQGSNTWDGMYDDVPPPAGIQGPNNPRGGIGHSNRGGRGGRAGSQGATPQPAIQAPVNAPTGPRNANVPGANYRGGGRGGRRGFHPYARGGA